MSHGTTFHELIPHHKTLVHTPVRLSIDFCIKISDHATLGGILAKPQGVLSLHENSCKDLACYKLNMVILWDGSRARLQR